MNEYELDAVKKAVDHVLERGAPGLAWPTKQAIRNNVILRLRHQFNLPAPLRSNDSFADVVRPGAIQTAE